MLCVAAWKRVCSVLCFEWQRVIGVVCVGWERVCISVVCLSGKYARCWVSCAWKRMIKVLCALGSKGV